MLITQETALREALADYQGCSWLTLDTEFIREDTYYPKLCLIQISDGRRAYCIDTLALGDLTPLGELLAQPRCVKVFHAAGQDLEVLLRLTGGCPTPLFDTQIAASLLGLGDQMGYAALVEKRCKVKLDKSLSRTDWARRPLTAAELAYALDDVRYLADLYPELLAELEARGRLSWVQEDCARMAQPERYQPHPEDEWRRLKGLSRLEPVAQHVAAGLVAWRETVAEARNRPRKWIIADEALYLIAERRPATLSQLQSLGALPPKTVERHGEALLQVVADSAQSAGPQPLVTEDRFSTATKARAQLLQQRVRDLAAALEIPSGMLAPRADIETLVLLGAAADIPLLKGWRREVAGEQLLALLVN